MSKTSNNANADTELHSLFVDELRDILWAEKHLVKALPKMAKAANDSALSDAFSKHTEETKGQIERLSQVFGILGLAARAKKCHAMEGLLKEADELADEYANSTALDAALISAGQKVEHYEIATYGTLVALAKKLGYGEAAEILQKTLDEEGAADKALTAAAESTANDAGLA